MYSELKELELQIIALNEKKEVLKKSLILEHAKFKKDETIMHKIKINCKYFPGGVITDIILGGGYIKDHYGNQKFNEYCLYYKFRPFGEIESYLINEEELIKKLK